MNINIIRKKVDSIISGSFDINEVLSIDIDHKHFDIPLLSLISRKIHSPSSYSDTDFRKLLSIYRNIELEKDKNKDIFIKFKETHGL